MNLARALGIDLSQAGGWEALEPAMPRVLEACRKTGKIPGTWAVGNGLHRMEQGFLFVTVCSDTQLINSGAKEMLQDLALATSTARQLDEVRREPALVQRDQPEAAHCVG